LFFWLEPKEPKVQDWIFLLKNKNFFKKIPVTRAEIKVYPRCQIIAATQTAGIFRLYQWTIGLKEILIFLNAKIS